ELQRSIQPTKTIGQVMLAIFVWLINVGVEVGVPALIIWGVVKYRSILIPLALGGLALLFFSALCGGLTYWLGSRKSRLLVFVGAIVAVWTIVDGAHRLGHDWSTLDTLN